MLSVQLRLKRKYHSLSYKYGQSNPASLLQLYGADDYRPQGEGEQ